MEKTVDTYLSQYCVIHSYHDIIYGLRVFLHDCFFIQTSVEPFVSYASQEDSLWTLIMTSPDGNLEDHSKELLHWFV